MRRQYKPDLSARLSPRVPQRLRSAVNRICRASDMPEADVLRYGFEAAVLLQRARKLRLGEPVGNPPLNAMVTVRTSPRMMRLVREIWNEYPKIEKAEILRRLLDEMVTVAVHRGMAHVMALREKALVR
jgi:hypothetical protein